MAMMSARWAQVFREMQHDAGVSPDIVTATAVVQAAKKGIQVRCLRRGVLSGGARVRSQHND